MMHAFFHAHPDAPDPHQDTFSKTILGFWVYLMSDCVLFATLFATYAVLHNNTFGGPKASELFSLPEVLIETLLLLFSSVACGLGLLAGCKSQMKKLVGWMAVAFVLGLGFVVMEFFEFKALVDEGHSWRQSAFLSSFFTLVGTHGTHVSFGLLWLGTLVTQILFKGLTVTTFRRLVCFGMFWHFLDLVWIFIFTFVYLMGGRPHGT